MEALREVSVEGCKFVQLKLRTHKCVLRVYKVSVEGCKFVQLKRGFSSINCEERVFQLKDVSLYN